MKRWIIILTLPSGSMFALGPNPKNLEDNTSLAMFPFDPTKENVLRGVFGFEDEPSAIEWLEEGKKLSPQSEKLFSQCKPMEASELQ